MLEKGVDLTAQNRLLNHGHAQRHACALAQVRDAREPVGHFPSDHPSVINSISEERTTTIQIQEDPTSE